MYAIIIRNNATGLHYHFVPATSEAFAIRALQSVTLAAIRTLRGHSPADAERYADAAFAAMRECAAAVPFEDGEVIEPIAGTNLELIVCAGLPADHDGQHHACAWCGDPCDKDETVCAPCARGEYDDGTEGAR